jgi:hypothetical protein
MTTFQSYHSKENAKRARQVAATSSPYHIEIRFLGGLNAAQKATFKKAADRWTGVIVGDSPTVKAGNDIIDDLLFEAQGVAIDGPGKILGQAGPTALRPANAAKAAFLPAKSIMSFDTADLAAMQVDGAVVDVITHEMGHVIGIGTVWEFKKLPRRRGSAKPTFAGQGAKAEFKALRALTGAAPNVPIEATAGRVRATAIGARQCSGMNSCRVSSRHPAIRSAA